MQDLDAVGHDVLRTSVAVVAVSPHAVACMPAQCLLILGSRHAVAHTPTHSATQGFENLMQSIIKHIVEVDVDIIVSGAWLCTHTHALC